MCEIQSATLLGTLTTGTTSLTFHINQTLQTLLHYETISTSANITNTGNGVPCFSCCTHRPLTLCIIYGYCLPQGPWLIPFRHGHRRRECRQPDQHHMPPGSKVARKRILLEKQKPILHKHVTMLRSHGPNRGEGLHYCQCHQRRYDAAGFRVGVCHCTCTTF